MPGFLLLKVDGFFRHPPNVSIVPMNQVAALSGMRSSTSGRITAVGLDELTNHESADLPRQKVPGSHTEKGSPLEMITTYAGPVTEPQTAGFPELPNQLEKDLVQIFKLLADETRLKILMYLLRDKEMHVSALCERLGQSQPAVSHHLALLRVSGLIEPRRDGKHNYYSVRTKHFHRVMAELFTNIAGENNQDGIRFQDFILSQESSAS